MKSRVGRVGQGNLREPEPYILGPGCSAGGTQPSGPGFGPKPKRSCGLETLSPGGASPRTPVVSVSHPRSGASS
eukprot:14023979-Alexandrium_andersonii.AAC.1